MSFFVLGVAIVSTLIARSVVALQVAPNSPCSSFCIDSKDLDLSDPNSSNTLNGDITCYDKDYSSSSAGLKFQRCMSCLQDSAFSQGSESDQAWFLYNLRYTFDYCVFGFPNATHVASTPCSTSTACGTLEVALTGDDLDATSLQAFGYCSADGGAMSESNIAHCKACVAATDGQDYMTNFMVALEAGCQQQPAAGVLLGLNDTIFAATTISAVDPSASAAAANTRTELPTTTIVGIAVGAIVVLLAVAGFFFVRCRARRNRSVRLVASPNPSAGKRSKHRPVSSLSFRCQTHLSPRSPKFFSSPIESTIHEEKPFAAPRSTFISSNTSPELAFSEFSSWTKPASKSERGARGNGPSLPLHNISTSIPTVPAGVYHSTSPKSRTFSPTDDMTTPASTTSTKSTSHLLPLRHYNPAEYGVAAPQMGTFLEATYVSPTSGTTASPLLSRAWDQKPPIWDKPLPPRGSSRPAINMINVLGKNKEKRSSGNTGSPVETKEIGVKFPGPPSPKRF